MPTLSELESILRDTGIPAIAYACVEPSASNRPGFGTTTFAIGEKNAESSVSGKVDLQTRFPASSLSKVMFAYLVLKLAEKKTIDLDKPLHGMLPYRRFLVGNDYPEKAKQVTARHVLSHTTGLPNFSSGSCEDAPLRFAEGSRLGEGYAYSGEAFLYLQKVLEAITGKDLETLAQEEIFRPLGMTRTTFLWRPPENNNVVSVHTEFGKPLPLYVDGVLPSNAASSLQTTADDFSTFLVAWLQEKHVLFNREAFTPVEDKTFMQCGFGWHLYKSAQGTIAYQYGCNPNTRAFTAIHVERKIGLAFFTNSENGLSLGHRLFSERIGDLRPVFEHLGFGQSDAPGWRSTLLGRKAEWDGHLDLARGYYELAAKEAPDDEGKQRRKVWFELVHGREIASKKFSTPLEVFQGTFTNTYNDKIEILIRNDRLIYQESGSEHPLVRISDNEFLPEKDQAFKVTLESSKMVLEYLQGPVKTLQKDTKHDDEAEKSCSSLRPR